MKINTEPKLFFKKRHSNYPFFLKLQLQTRSPLFSQMTQAFSIKIKTCHYLQCTVFQLLNPMSSESKNLPFESHRVRCQKYVSQVQVNPMSAHRRYDFRYNLFPCSFNPQNRINLQYVVCFGFLCVHTFQQKDLPQTVPLCINYQFIFRYIFFLAVLSSTIDQRLGNLAESCYLYFTKKVLHLLHFQKDILNFLPLYSTF